MSKKGFVYVMRSPRTSLLKIGRSAKAPHFRAKELSTGIGYAGLGPWSVVDYRHVIDAERLERALHARFKSQNIPQQDGSRELSSLSEQNAVTALIEGSEAVLVGSKPVGKLRVHPDLLAYLRRLFRETGLQQFLDLQELWTMSVFSSTAGGRDFTINIDRHEVAFASPTQGESKTIFMLYVDAKLAQNHYVENWLRAHAGGFSYGHYKSARPDGVGIHFVADYREALEVFSLNSMRRAMIAYWYYSLLNLKDRGGRSLFARYHNHNAVAEIMGTN